MKPEKTRWKVPLLALTILLVASLACSFLNKTDDIQEETQSEQQAPTEEPSFLEQPASGGKCYHAYYPISQGATWVYEMSGSVADSYTHTILAAGESEFVDQDTFESGTTRTGQWKCEDGNLITLTPGGSTSVAAGGQTFSFTITSNSGTTLPATLEIGSTWSQEITYEGSQDAGGVTITSVNEATTTCTATGLESVSVPAGTFNAMRVECTGKISISISGADPIVIETPSTAWYVEDIGMVKTVSSGGGFDTTIELKSYQIP